MVIKPKQEAKGSFILIYKDTQGLTKQTFDKLEKGEKEARRKTQKHKINRR